ncbi:MAG: hypothetical protein LBQ31_06370 [Bacteroidales bacterium]|nr:hypothetical protein [Bacteroidales bacterium]
MTINNVNKSLSLGIVRASVSSALAYSRLCSGNPFIFTIIFCIIVVRFILTILL